MYFPYCLGHSSNWCPKMSGQGNFDWDEVIDKSVYRSWLRMPLCSKTNISKIDETALELRERLIGTRPQD